MNVFLEDPVGFETKGLYLDKVRADVCKDRSEITVRGFLCRGPDADRLFTCQDPYADGSHYCSNGKAGNDLRANVECDIYDSNGNLAIISFARLNGSIHLMKRVSFVCSIKMKGIEEDLPELRIRIILDKGEIDGRGNQSQLNT